MILNRNLFRTLFVAACIFGAVACGGSSEPAPAAATEPEASTGGEAMPEAGMPADGAADPAAPPAAAPEAPPQ